jgi:hypothetical protein
MEGEDSKPADGEDADAAAKKDGMNGNLVSAQDPEYKAEPASESPAETETPEGNEDASPTDGETDAEAEPETVPENE